MAEYIEREAALEKISNAVWWAQDDIVSVALSAAKWRVRKIPAAEVAPVRHGRWIDWDVGQGMGIWHKCSECGDGEELITNFCPNCGAKMDGGADGA